MSPKDSNSMSVRLRPLQSSDAATVHELLSDERVVRHMLFPRFTREMAEAFVERFESSDPTGAPPQVVFGICHGSATCLVGICGLVLDATQEQGEAWYLLAPDLWGRGLVTHAARELLDHGFRRLGLHRIWASTLPENPASSRVLEKLGFRHEGLHRRNLRIHGEWRDSNTYAILKSEWDGSGHDEATA